MSSALTKLIMEPEFMDTSQAYQEITARFVQWAQSDDDLRAAVIVGSRARSDDHPADEWADLDIVVFARQVETYLNSREWISHMGEAWLSFVENTATGGFFERRVIYAGGLDVDYAFIPAIVAKSAAQGGDVGDFPSVIRRGFSIILDKDRLFDNLADLAAAWQPPSPPSLDLFLNEIEDFWYHTVWTAKHLRRGEIWWAKGGCDGALKERLRKMLEWQAQALHGSDHDTWIRGRFLEEWADPQTVTQLKQCFAHYDPADIWNALFATMDVFSRVARQTASAWGFPYPDQGEGHARTLVEQLRQ
jgi:aminoglycoside 6-adenylyltransferase